MNFFRWEHGTVSRRTCPHSRVSTTEPSVKEEGGKHPKCRAVPHAHGKESDCYFSCFVAGLLPSYLKQTFNLSKNNILAP